MIDDSRIVTLTVIITGSNATCVFTDKLLPYRNAKEA